MKRTVKRLGRKVLLLAVGVMVIVIALSWLYSESIVDRSILTDSPCAAPCWQGIVPGTPMTTEEIAHLLARMPNVDVDSISEHSLPQGTAIRWWWKPWPWRHTGAGSNSVFLMGGVVHDIVLSVDFELTVEEILDRYGFPEATNAMQAGVPECPYVAMNLFYPTRGLTFTARVLPWYRPLLEPTTRIFEVVYTLPSESLESWRESHDFEIYLQPWPGYGELQVPDL